MHENEVTKEVTTQGATTNISQKLKDFLNKKSNESKIKIKKLKRKRTAYKIIFITTASSSVVISCILASISSLTLPPAVVPILSITGGVLTGISAKFNIEDRKTKINKEIERLSKIETRLDYVASCNGNLTPQQYQQIISEFIQ